MLNPYVTVDTAVENGVIGPHVTFHGVNVHIVADSGATDDNTNGGSPGTLTGLGNLFIGYDDYYSGSSVPAGVRGGSHNLIIRDDHTFVGAGTSTSTAAYGDLILGSGNNANGGLSFCAGDSNSFYTNFNSILVGSRNVVTRDYGVVVGGSDNYIYEDQSVIVGRRNNQTWGSISVILGGGNDVVHGGLSVIVGGLSNTENGGQFSVVLGGHSVSGPSTLNGDYSIYPLPPFPQ
jgi:hypothetical protein